MKRYGWRPHLEDALELSLKTLVEMGSFAPNKTHSGTLTWTDKGREVGEVEFVTSLTDTEGVVSVSHVVIDRTTKEAYTSQYAIRVETMPLHLGGHRWFFRCPASNRRALKLYMFQGQEKFCCREALDPQPTYLSQRLPIFDEIMRQRWKLRAKLKDNASLVDSILKPRWMHWRTFFRHAAREKDLREKALKAFHRRLNNHARH